MKFTKKLTASLLTLVMAFSLAACGGDDTPPADDTVVDEVVDQQADDVEEEEEGVDEVAAYGDFAAVLVPAGFTWEKDFWNEQNEAYIKVLRSDFAYFEFMNYFEQESDMLSAYQSVKDTYTNEQVDVSATYNGIEWIGFQYSDGFGGYGFEVYTTIGQNFVRVSGTGFAFDHETAQAVLGSLEMAK